MTRLQKKCLIATAGTHLLLVVLLFCSGFISSKPKPDDTQLLEVIPANVIEAAFSSGVKDAPKAAPKPPEIQPPPPPVQLPVQPPPEPPKPEVKPDPTPVKQPDPLPLKPLPEKLPDDDLVPVKPTPKPPKREVKIDLVLHKATKPNVTKPEAPDTTAADEAREQRRLQKERAARIARLAQNLKENLSSTTTVEMPGAGSVSYASYASVVKSVYEQAWSPPDDTASDDAITKVSVTIASDGRVLDAHILNASGDARVDASVRRTLDRVTTIREFPEGAKEKEKTFIINFNLKSKRSIG